VHADRDAVQLQAFDAGVVGFDVLTHCLVGVDTDGAPLVAAVVDDVVRVVRVVELDVGAAEADDLGDLAGKRVCAVSGTTSLDRIQQT